MQVSHNSCIAGVTSSIDGRNRDEVDAFATHLTLSLRKWTVKLYKQRCTLERSNGFDFHDLKREQLTGLRGQFVDALYVCPSL